VSANEEHDNAMVTIENEDVNETNTKHHETNENSGKQEIQTKLQTIDPPKLKRSESAFSKVSNVSVHAHNSTLSSKVFLLEENLKRLQNIVCSLIPQVDANNNVTDIHDNSTQYRERSTSMGLIRHEQVKGSKIDSGHTTESMSEGLAESALKRPVTQPVVASANRKPEFPRSKTTGLLVRKNKPLIRQGSMPLKLKPRQCVSTIHEEVQQGEHGIEEVTKDNIGTQGEFGKEEARHDKEDKGDTQGEAWTDDDVNMETQPNEGMKSMPSSPVS
jgi:hypothetical protein